MNEVNLSKEKMIEEYGIEKNSMFCFLNLVVYGKMHRFEQVTI
jgi:hypothetical protein